MKSYPLKDILPDVHYTVLVGDAVFMLGDRIIMGSDRCLVCREAGGFLPPEEWACCDGVLVGLDREYYQVRLARLQKELKLIMAQFESEFRDLPVSDYTS